MDHFHGNEEENEEEESGENEDEATDPSLLILNLLSDFLDDEVSIIKNAHNSHSLRFFLYFLIEF